jgi:hypothetical protein
MNRVHQLLFVVSILVLNWLAMMAVHELGHVIGAIGSGGWVSGLVLHPLTISRTDVSPNPGKSIVAYSSDGDLHMCGCRSRCDRRTRPSVPGHSEVDPSGR